MMKSTKMKLFARQPTLIPAIHLLLSETMGMRINKLSITITFCLHQPWQLYTRKI